MRYEHFQQRLIETMLNARGDTDTAQRRGAMQRMSLSGSLAAYVEKVARHAYKVTDHDIAALHEAGHSDDGIFEITVAAAVGAAMHRLERGMAALRGQEPD
jgi:alkylhydroperoxidase family enzyme